MTVHQRIEALVALGEYLGSESKEIELATLQSHRNNQWFTPKNIKLSLDAIRHEFLEESKLRNWVANYDIPTENIPKTVGLVMAGNIPAVGFHDMLCVFVAGHKAQIKFSDKDRFLIPMMIKFLNEQFPATKAYFEIVPTIKNFDAVIATGSNNSARYFESYFSKVPNIIRRNRNSVAVLTGKENEEALIKLGIDVFQYFGLGCRNVSKFYIPKDYDFVPLQEALHTYKNIVNHNKYKNNFDYYFTLLILNKIPHKATGCLLMNESEEIATRIACVHYEYYDDTAILVNKLNERKDEIQCVVSELDLAPFKTIPFGDTQSPTLTDYPDDIDIMDFLLG